MLISQDLLDLLRCPICIKPVPPLPDFSGLKCEVCHRVYPIRNEIAVMLAEEAVIAKD